MRDSGLIIEVELPELYEADEQYVKRRVMLLFNGATPYAMYQREGKVVLQAIDREVIRYGVEVVDGAQYQNVLETLSCYT